MSDEHTQDGSPVDQVVNHDELELTIPTVDTRVAEFGKCSIPSKAHDSDAGFDVYAAEYGRILPKTWGYVKLGMKTAIPDGYFALVLPRSGLAARHGLMVHPGLIDAGYRGEWVAMIFNAGQEDFGWAMGDRIAQAVILPIIPASFVQVAELDETERGHHGFGSTGR